MHEQLRAHRWGVSEIRTKFDRSSFSARKDGLLLDVAIDKAARPGQTTIGFRLASPWWTLPVTLLGVLVGALLGWVCRPASPPS